MINNTLEKQPVNRVLAYRIYPLPNGTSYHEDDLENAEM